MQPQPATGRLPLCEHHGKEGTAMKSLKNMTGDSLEQMIDYKVVDQNGDEIGSLHSLWSDPSTGAVEFLGVKTGWLFGHNHVVPAEKAELDETQNVVRLPYTGLFVKEAPSISADAEISEAEEENIYRYYGLGGASSSADPMATADMGSASASGTTHNLTSTDLDNLPEAAGASSLASASGRDEAGSQFGAPTSTGGGDTGVSRLRKTVRTDTAGTQTSPETSAGSYSGTPSAGSAVRGALDSLSPGDSSSTSTTTSSAAAPSSYGTTNLYGSTGSATPVSADSLGTSMDAPAGGGEAATTTGYLGSSMDSGPTTGERSSTTTGYLDADRSVEPGVNPDPITGEPGSHPVGTGAGALAGGAAGLAIGSAIGGPIGAPVGAAIGAVVGSVGGGYAGKGIAETINPTEENAYWESNYKTAPYYENDYDFADYSPAYRVGYEGYGRHAGSGKDYPEVESDLARDYDQSRGESRLIWEKAKAATRDAWNRAKTKTSEATK